MDKEHFNRILRDVEANTLRLQEHGKDVLILERVVKQRGLTAFKYVNKQTLKLCVGCVKAPQLSLHNLWHETLPLIISNLL